ncbi:MAG: hypothetical protein ACE5J6_03895 [Candidatus Bathyarchaeia archaeon]
MIQIRNPKTGRTLRHYGFDYTIYRKVRVYHPKSGKRIYLEIPDKIRDPETNEVIDLSDVRPHMFKEFAQAVLGYFKKIKDPIPFGHIDLDNVAFNIERARNLFKNKDPRIAKKYLLILYHNGLVKYTKAPPYPSYILACETAQEEFQAKVESTSSILGAEAYDRVKAWASRRSLIADIIGYRLSNGPLPWLRYFFT